MSKSALSKKLESHQIKDWLDFCPIHFVSLVRSRNGYKNGFC